MEQCRHREPWNSARDPIVYVLRSSSSFRQNRHFCWSLLSVTDLYKGGFKSNVKSWFYYTLLLVHITNMILGFHHSSRMRYTLFVCLESMYTGDRGQKQVSQAMSIFSPSPTVAWETACLRLLTRIIATKLLAASRLQFQL